MQNLTKTINKSLKIYKKDLQKDNPWNTYTRKGMPLTPICNPGVDAIKAAANPYITEFLYFVSDGKGGHRFSNNLKEHNINVRLWKRKKMKKNKINRLGIMLVISSPSGAGKTTLARKLLEQDPNIKLSVSVTTREPRKSEKNNKDYIFVDTDKFDEMVKNNELLEFAKVFGNNYGTPRKLVENRINKGKDVLFDIDWQGTQALREMEPKHLVSVFILLLVRKN